MKVVKLSEVQSEDVNTPLFTGGEVTRQTPFVPDDLSSLNFGVVSFGTARATRCTATPAIRS